MTLKTLTWKSGGVDMKADLYAPPVGMPKGYPLVVLAYGTGGMMAPFGDMYHNFAEGLSMAGFGCLLPDYLARTTTPHTLEMFGLLASCGTAWVAALHDSIAMGVALAEVDAHRVAVGGFSLGSNLMIHAVQTSPAKAFVDFFAPTVSHLVPASVVTPAMAAKMPPTLIHHGEQDGTVPIGDSVLLLGWLKSAGVSCEMISYSKQGHPSVTDASSWNTKSQTHGLDTTVGFLKSIFR